MKRCAKCGAACADSDTYCGVCGAPLPAWGRPAPTGDGFAVASMVLGIIGICTFWFGLGVITSILAVIFSLIVLCTARRRAVGHGMAIAGLVTGGLALFITLLIVVFLIAIGSAASSQRQDTYSDTGGALFSHTDGGDYSA
ncbi:DUF4190 domain-containing protein [Ethanoligenens harbinense]|uniref:DUF4190 domain-containing protein n=1 Tax=Ethanoligenens harbinense (strain DSM 18485 / JCM 12961 / CGMCC 1.5033 / YUAN-3) TaxID=663278 RepID=E6U8X6_ETHHY|nr:DUF4190 domain-containing protein [Ethanoligenens harbinense]ADU26040.1 hypothetical protein Ethha_0455 [Ethanoligenens harbinense YUAN-3]AVQ95184.1 hypothetical protein CXQ68_02360 [Ethanoligenens harbinense YUAN-3]AYF37874.1 hypothetical protein CXP51_02370 [Ethanoligenens harbinense]AYF40598.1 hypothetical protein CN246_02365 [Ethanoligenens harbinense]QCN91431.1 hypothetical protein DRA42_02370 [Ethanoligenens harbinense]